MKSSDQIKLFLVEDSFVYSYLLEETLREHGNFKVTSFSSGEACMQMLNNDPDLIILDYNLEEGMNGLEVLKEVHSQKPKTPVIILSSQTDVQVAADLLKEGAFDYIEKKKEGRSMEKLQSSILKALKIQS